MGLEFPTYISDLVSANPVGATDSYVDGDNHLRNLKLALKNTFTALNGAVNSSHTELSLMASKTAGALMASGNKTEFMQAAAPSGWTQDTALNDKIIRVASGAGAASGGTWLPSGWTVGGTALAETQIPSHTHTVQAGGDHTHSMKIESTGGGAADATVATGGDSANINSPSATSSDSHSHTINSTGGGAAHAHSGVYTGDTWRPAYVDVIICAKS